MNIHFTDQKVFELLKQASIFSIEIGSKMYGTFDEESDTDILYIYLPCIEELTSFVSTHHQFQYKENGIDHLFINIFQFFRNALNGDSTINFEVIHHPSLENSALDWIYRNRNIFINYRIVKSYLGLARRDLKQVAKEGTLRDKNKRIAHILRGYHFCQSLLINDFTPIITGKLLNEINAIKQITDARMRHEIGKQLGEQISELRKFVNEQLDSQQLQFPFYMTSHNQNLLDMFIQELIKQKGVQSNAYYALLKPKIYDVNEHGLEY